MIADPSELTPEAKAHIWAVLRNMNTSLRKHLLSGLPGGRDFRAESTIDFLVKNDPDSADDTVRQLVRHRREV